MATFFEAIIRGGVSLPLHLFIVEVLAYFNIAPFQFTPNSICTTVEFYIAFKEANIGKASMVEFTFVYNIKALARSKNFWYTNKRGLDMEGVLGICDNMGNYKDRYFFYPSYCPGEFRVASK